MALPNEIPEPPKWLQDFRAKTKFLKIIDMAYDTNYSDKDVRFALIEASQEMNELGEIVQPQ